MSASTAIARNERIIPPASLGYPSTVEVPRIYIVSDVRLYREGLTASLNRPSHLKIVGSGSSSEPIEQIVCAQPHVLLLDLATSDNLALSSRVRALVPALQIIAFAVEELEESVLACAQAGICGLVSRDGSVEDLVAAVASALKGELLCSPRIAGLLFSQVAKLSGVQANPKLDILLTPREREIAALLARDLHNKEIARRLKLGPATIKNHVHNILQKLNVRRRSEVARLHLSESSITARIDTA
jgi:two-component system, NarL family, nitrate/nitrite response regulator NarL